MWPNILKFVNTDFSVYLMDEYWLWEKDFKFAIESIWKSVVENVVNTSLIFISFLIDFIKILSDTRKDKNKAGGAKVRDILLHWTWDESIKSKLEKFLETAPEEVSEIVIAIRQILENPSQSSLYERLTELSDAHSDDDSDEINQIRTILKESDDNLSNINKLREFLWEECDDERIFDMHLLKWLWDFISTDYPTWLLWWLKESITCEEQKLSPAQQERALAREILAELLERYSLLVWLLEDSLNKDKAKTILSELKKDDSIFSENFNEIKTRHLKEKWITEEEFDEVNLLFEEKPKKEIMDFLVRNIQNNARTESVIFEKFSEKYPDIEKSKLPYISDIVMEGFFRKVQLKISHIDAEIDTESSQEVHYEVHLCDN